MEGKKRKRSHEEGSRSITLQKLLLQVFGQHTFAKALWKEEKKKMKKIIASQGEEIVELKEKLESQKQRMDRALKLVDQTLACRPPPRVYAMCLKEKFLLFQLMLTHKNVNVEFKST